MERENTLLHKKMIAAVIGAGLLVIQLTGCGQESGNTSELSKTEEVNLIVAGPWSDCKALEDAATDFNRQYPNCHVSYEYLQDFSDTLPKRLESGDEPVDMFLTGNIQKDSPLLPYAAELSSQGEQLELSNTFDGLMENARLQKKDEAEKELFYSIPLGAEVRGMFVNVTLLKSLGLSVPENRAELLEACRVLKENGYVPFQGNPGTFSQQLLYPYCCNLVANAEDYEAAYALIDSRDEQAASLFEEPMRLMYELADEEYYNYKYCETELNLFLDASNEGYARSFLNILETENGYEKKDDLGQVAFMPSVKSLEQLIQQTKEDYHSQIEYEFILAPVGEEGGYAYLSPGRAIAISNQTKNQAWCNRFVSFLLETEHNIKFCDTMGFVPNNKNAMTILSKEFDVPKERISQLGQVTFSYDFYSPLTDALMAVSKSNNPKYMEEQADGSMRMYSFDYYMEQLKKGLTGEAEQENE